MFQLFSRRVYIGAALVVLFAGLARVFLSFYSYYPADLAVHSVEVVSRSELPVIMGERADTPFIESAGSAGFLKVTLRTKEDLFLDFAPGDYTIYPQAFFCSKRSLVVRLVFSGLFENAIEKFDIWVNKTITLPGNRGTGGVFFFDTILVLERNEKFELPSALKKNNGQKYYLRFNLVKKPEDICMHLGGGNVIGYSYRSNEVRIDKSVLEAAIRRKVSIGGD